MKVSLDGGITFQEAPQGVRVWYDWPLPDKEEDGSVDFVFSDEGLIVDVWDDEEPDHCIGTSCETIDEIVHRLVSDNA